MLVQYFETDDQEFYKTKVCFILNNDVSEMDLVFAEERYNKSGQLEKVTTLISDITFKVHRASQSAGSVVVKNCHPV